MTFDHFAYCSQCSTGAAWGQHPLLGLQLSYPIEAALERSKSAEATAEYLDLHAWHFSPASFELLILELARLGETDWQVERTTEATGCEFYTWLRRGGRAAAAALSGEVLAARRLALLKRTLLETQAQIDWLLAGEPELRAQHAAAATQSGTGSAASSQYVDWFPARENAGRAFEGQWSSSVPGLALTGATPLFDDSRIVWFGERLGGFAGKKVLELGPLECGHTYMMTQRGAAVTAIESNVRAWTRCLAVIDALNMTGVTLLLGSFIPYLAKSPPKVDFLLASGVLYHMTDPVGFLQNVCRATDAVGIWTQYFDPDIMQVRVDQTKFDLKPRPIVTEHGRTVELYDQRYLDALKWSGFCGGSAPGSSWMRRQDILGILEDEGFRCETFLDQPDHPNGPAFCVFGRRA